MIYELRQYHSVPGRLPAVLMSDPEWIAKPAEPEHDGAILANVTSQIPQPTSFSSVR